MTKQGDRSPGLFRNAMDAGLGIVLLKFLVGLVIVLGLTGSLDSVLNSVRNLLNSSESHAEPRKPSQKKTPAVDATTRP